MVYYKEKGDANIMLKIPKKFEPCFWDTEFEKLDTEENKYYIISRLYNKGGISGITWVEDNYSIEDITEATKLRRDFHPIVANYLRKKMWIKKRTNELLQNVTRNSMEVTIMFWETLDDHRIELLKYQRKIQSLLQRTSQKKEVFLG